MKPLAEAVRELGADTLLAELAAGRQVACWLDTETYQHHDIPIAYWRDGGAVRDWTLRTGNWLDYSPPKARPLLHAAGARWRSVFVAQRHPGGRPAEYDWEGARIHVERQIREKGRGGRPG
jgi:hypothetical protein